MNNTQIDSCYSCNSCNYCNYCYSCYSCNSCKFCKFCNSCNYCDSCNYSKNLKMCEYQLFCFAEKNGSQFKDSYQQKQFRVFNTQMTKEEYQKIKIPKIKLEFDNSINYCIKYETAFKKAWDKLTTEEKQEFFNIPHFDWEIFTKITGVEKKVENPIKQMTQAQIEAELGYKVNIIE